MSVAVTDDRPEAQVLVLFGATGDLAKRKLFPGLYRLAAAGRLPTDYAIVGSGRNSPGSDDEFRQQVRDGLVKRVDDLDDELADELISRVSFCASTADDGADLAAAVRRAVSWCASMTARSAPNRSNASRWLPSPASAPLMALTTLTSAMPPARIAGIARRVRHA